MYANYHKNPNTGLPDIIKDDKHRLKYIDSVYRLLNNYVEKALGQKEADSFVTKIQLEGRLSIQEIISYSGKLPKAAPEWTIGNWFFTNENRDHLIICRLGMLIIT